MLDVAKNGVLLALREEELGDLITGLSAALYRDGEGAFGGGAGWTPETLFRMRTLQGRLESLRASCFPRE